MYLSSSFVTFVLTEFTFYSFSQTEATRKDALKVNEGDKIAVECKDTPISPPGVCGLKKRPRSEEVNSLSKGIE